jgi:hypothetical protein
LNTLIVPAVLALGCGGTSSSTEATGEAGEAGSVGSGTDAGSSDSQGDTTTSGGDGSLDLPGGDGDCPGEPTAIVTGTVHAPNGEIPVSGALVYTTTAMPSGIPQEVYCAECEELPPCVEYGFTAPDGSFSVPSRAGDDQYLVVVKGQFMRITPVDITQGNNPQPVTVTDLPGTNDPASGLYIPKIAVGMSSPDQFEIVLGKIGLGDIDSTGVLVPNTESFDLYDNGNDPTWSGFASAGLMTDLVTNPTALAQYHVLFVPCIGGSGLAEIESNPQAATNVREWVEAGGRIYATDYAQDWIEALFPDYQTFNGEPGPPTPIGAFDSTATVLDADLLSWLQSLPPELQDINPMNGGGTTYPTLGNLPQVEILDNYTGIELPLPSVLVDDGMGGQIDLGHVAWLEGTWPGAGGTYPPSVMGQYGCGRLHFTSYHTTSFPHLGMAPQELIMMYSVLEVGVCQSAVPPID